MTNCEAPESIAQEYLPTQDQLFQCKHQIVMEEELESTQSIVALRSDVQQLLTARTQQQTVLVYILFLELGKLFVGTAKNLEQFKTKLKNHQQGVQCQWTFTYKLLKDIEPVVIENRLATDEQLYFIKLIREYGQCNVRSSFYCHVELSRLEKLSLGKQYERLTQRSLFRRIKRKKPIKKSLIQKLASQFARAKKFLIDTPVNYFKAFVN